GLRAQGSGLRAQGSGLRAQGSGLRAQGSGLRAQGSGLRAPFFLEERERVSVKRFASLFIDILNVPLRGAAFCPGRGMFFARVSRAWG
ncbi:MAG: hypothetical protein LBD04_09785, partial [Synergistaceae bacterium]|nr:hypothetical protein [Synergistaceae bacterium]